MNFIRENTKYLMCAMFIGTFCLGTNSTLAGQPAARITDMHVCPMVTGIVPHVGGPIINGVASVEIQGLPAAVVGDTATCIGPPDTLIRGSTSVLIGGKPAVRLGDQTAHGGTVITGALTVLIGG